MKRSFFILCSLLSFTGTLQAGETFTMDVETVKNQALQKTHDKIQDPFTLLDVDSNGKLSRRECSGTDEAYKYIPFFTDAEKDDLKQKINDAFDRFDQDKDEYLNQEEAQNYIAHIEQLALEMQMTKMDANGDGKITEDEMMSLVQSMPDIEESMAKLKEVTENLQKTNDDPQEHTNEMISDIDSTEIQEQVSGIDKDKDNKITAEEYINYMINHPDNQKLKFTTEDYQGIFNLIDSQKRGYITEQEYFEYNQKQLNDLMSETKE